VLGSYRDVVDTVRRVDVDTVIVTGADDLGPIEMRRLGWDLESINVALIVAPALTDIAGPRIHTRPVAGLPLIHVDFPRFEGRKRLSKRLFDVVSSAVLLVIFSPLLVTVALAVKLTSPGGAFYVQERIGFQGRPFGMLKFRSMVAGADDQLMSLLDSQGSSDQPLFKVNNDPRITRVGAFIRRYSLDELPQLINVFMGQMSLVGPRPQRNAEVQLYDDAAHRRLFMKPGISGLWQVSGRSNLTWDDSIRLDLYYVENWSMTVDLTILFRTIRTVVRAEGAV
jgi:exopolysaccharide biosynthesis polyprenyl glycosylphosphotransferase